MVREFDRRRLFLWEGSMPSRASAVQGLGGPSMPSSMYEGVDCRLRSSPRGSSLRPGLRLCRGMFSVEQERDLSGFPMRAATRKYKGPSSGSSSLPSL